jgi:hypothetical protein
MSEHKMSCIDRRVSGQKRALDEDDEEDVDCDYVLPPWPEKASISSNVSMVSSRLNNMHLNRFGVSWLDRSTKVTRQVKTIELKEDAQRALVSRESYSTNPMRDLQRSSGDDRLRGMMRDLDRFGVVRTGVQKLFHFWFTQAILELIYGDEWDTNALRVMEDMGLNSINHEVTVMTPRRFGKTYAVAMFVVAVLLNVPGIRIGIFSTCKRASGSLMKIAMKFINEVPGAERRVCKYSGEEMCICAEPLPAGKSVNSGEARRRQALKTTSQVNSYPGGVVGKFFLLFDASCIVVYVSSRGGWDCMDGASSVSDATVFVL